MAEIIEEVKLTYRDGDERIIKTLTGPDAIRWRQMFEEASGHAFTKNAGLDFDSLPWKVEREKAEG